MTTLFNESSFHQNELTAVAPLEPKWKVLIVCGMWFPFHSVQRILRPFVKDMHEHFEVRNDIIVPCLYSQHRSRLCPYPVLLCLFLLLTLPLCVVTRSWSCMPVCHSFTA